MNKHFICLTVDTDPDGLSGKTTNRQTLEFNGLDALQSLPGELEASPGLQRIPLTWFIRADGQLKSILGTAAYLLERYEDFWATLREAGHELAWHPHLYRQPRSDAPAEMITDQNEAEEELRSLWSEVEGALPCNSFRNGEGWHTPQTYTAVEELGFRCDSTAIPGRAGRNGHPMRWEGAPNEAYYPSISELCESGPERQMLELPMNTWMVQAPYDDAPKLRYINPAWHPEIFADAVENWENTRKISSHKMSIWVMIFHPDEVFGGRQKDHLYARSREALSTNLLSFQESLQRSNIDFEWVTIADAAEAWRRSQLKKNA